MEMIKNYFLLKKLEKQNIFIKKNTQFKNATFQGRNKIGRNCDVRGSEIGFASYIGDDCYLRQCKIGKFCSIASWVKVITGNHPLHYVTTHSISYNNYLRKLGVSSDKKIPFDKLDYCCDNYFIDIGNDVWIGQDVQILNGVKIGHGAVLAAGAVVVKDVEPYAIVGGVPAKLIKKRFDDETIKKLLELKFWDKSLEWLKENADKLSNVEEFINFCEKENKESL